MSILLLGSPPVGFSGGLSQIQSNGLSGGGDYPFINLLKTAPNWAYLDNTGSPTPDQMTSDGLPIHPVTNSGWVTLFTKPAQTDRPGDYYIVTTGSGVVAYQGGSFTAVSGVGNKLLISGSVIPNRAYNFYIQSTDAVDPLSFIAICHEDDVAGVVSADLQSYIETEIFQQSFIDFVRAIRPAENRFLNWQNGNLTNETSWASRKPETYWSYGAHRMVDQQFDAFLNCYVGWMGTCGGGNNVYTVSDSSGSAAPADKQYLTLKFPAASVTCTSGANAQISWTAHGLNTGDPFLLAGSAPGGVTIFDDGTTTFYAIVDDANTIRFATTQANALAGTAVTTSSTGSGLLAQATIIGKVVSSVSIPSSNFTFSEPHLFSTGDSISIQSTSALPSNINSGGNYFAIASSSTILQLAATYADAIAGTPITLTGSASGGITVVKNPQLNLNGTGNVSIKSFAGTQVNTDSTPSGTRPLARTYGSVACFGTVVYDADLNSWLLYGCQDSQSVVGVTSGIPPEIALKLCVKLGCHPWWVSPFLSLSFKVGSARGLTDYMPSLMAYARDTMPSWMKPTFEGYNEDWNFITPGTNYSYVKAFVYWGSNDIHSYVGRYASLLGQAAVAAFGGGVGDKCEVLVGVQGGTFLNAAGSAGSDQRLLSDSFVNNGPSVPSGYVQEPAYKWCTYISGANYYTPNLTHTTAGSLNEASMAEDWVAGGSNLSDPLLSQFASSIADTVFNATISGSTMTVTSIASGQIYTADMGAGATYINGPGIEPYTYQIVSGESGGNGVYTLSGAPGDGSYTLKCGKAFSIEGLTALCTNYIAWARGTAQPGGKWGGAYQLKAKPYEGGYSPDLNNTVVNINSFRWASKFTDDAGAMVNGGTLSNGIAISGVYNDFIAAGVERPSLFQLAGGAGNGTSGAASNVWCVMDPDRYIALPPQMSAIIAFNHP